MTLMRETTSGATARLLCRTSRSTPSTRKRTTRRFSNGSTWMSEAFSLTACVSTALIRRMMGASSSLSSRSACSGRSCARCARSVDSSTPLGGLHGVVAGFVGQAQQGVEVLFLDLLELAAVRRDSGALRPWPAAPRPADRHTRRCLRARGAPARRGAWRRRSRRVAERRCSAVTASFIAVAVAAVAVAPAALAVRLVGPAVRRRVRSARRLRAAAAAEAAAAAVRGVNGISGRTLGLRPVRRCSCSSRM